jgi:hypothetical protein
LGEAPWPKEKSNYDEQLLVQEQAAVCDILDASLLHITETNGIHLILFGMQQQDIWSLFGSHTCRILSSVMQSEESVRQEWAWANQS